MTTPPASTADFATTGTDRLSVLDGFRALSILFVLAAHMLPLGPHRFELNLAAGELGMVIFFTLSGFLITQQLHTKRNVLSFFVRRLFRILPLAWAYSAFALLLVGAGLRVWLATFGFAITYDLSSMRPVTGHFWSLCVEVHFYLGVGLLMALTRFRGFVVLPVFWALFVTLRLLGNPLGTIETHLRVDEILSGALLALVYLGDGETKAKRFVASLPLPLLIAGLLLACHPITGPFNAARGLFSSLMVGNVLLRSGMPRFAWLEHRVLRYVAEVSYAVYVIHPMSMYGWLGSGSTIVKYAKRPLCFAITFGVAHLSTFYYERYFLGLGKKLAKRVETRATAPSGLAVDVPAA